MAWHTPEYKRYLKSNAWPIRKNAYYRRHNRHCVACGNWKRIQLHHVTYDWLGHEPDRDLAPHSVMPAMSMPIGRISRSGSKIFESRRRRLSGSVVLAKPVTISTANSFAGSCPAWVAVVSINVLDNFGGNCMRARPPSRCRLAAASCFVRYNSHSMIVESTSSSMRVIVANHSSASGEPMCASG
jgi:hypothetical protein